MSELKSNIADDQIGPLIRAHCDLQLGCYFSSIEPCASGLISTSDSISDHYWNSMSSFHESDTDRLISASEPLFAKKKRSPAYYIDPTSTPTDILHKLENKGYTVEREIWMSAGNLSSTILNNAVSIRPVNNTNSDDFLRVFSIAFGGEASEADGYGDIPPEYLTALRTSLGGSHSRDVIHHHFLAYLGDNPVACGSIHIGTTYAGLYNVGTLPNYRQLGVGTAVSLSAVRFAKEESSVTTIFFQTQPGGTVQRFYEGLGCTVLFDAAIAYKA
jgi:ribosomal protein S18 acetylase RimI-like enzyme